MVGCSGCISRPWSGYTESLGGGCFRRTCIAVLHKGIYIDQAGITALFSTRLVAEMPFHAKRIDDVETLIIGGVHLDDGMGFAGGNPPASIGIGFGDADGVDPLCQFDEQEGTEATLEVVPLGGIGTEIGTPRGSSLHSIQGDRAVGDQPSGIEFFE